MKDRIIIDLENGTIGGSFQVKDIEKHFKRLKEVIKDG